MEASSKASFLVACLLANLSSYAGRSNDSEKNHYARSTKQTVDMFPLPTRAHVDAAADTNAFLYGDALISLAGSKDNFVFLDTTVKGGTDKGWLAALGMGLEV